MENATETIINGINVKFPFKPYQVQYDYMEKVIQSLTESQNAILESPTGSYSIITSLHTRRMLKFLIFCVSYRHRQNTVSIVFHISVDRK